MNGRFKEIDNHAIPITNVYVDIKEGRFEVSKLTNEQFVEAFGCTRKEFSEAYNEMEKELSKTTPLKYLRGGIDGTR